MVIYGMSAACTGRRVISQRVCRRHVRAGESSVSVYVCGMYGQESHQSAWQPDGTRRRDIGIVWKDMVKTLCL